MMQNSIYRTFTSLLAGIGFTPSEASVYLACLELGGGAASGIAVRAKLNRVTTYEILKRLQKRGAVTKYLQRKVWHFLATDPRVVVKQARERVSRAELHMPDLMENLMQRVRRPKISYFEGIDGIKAMYDDSLTAKGGEICTITNPKDLRQLLSDLGHDNYVAERVRRKITVRGLAPDDSYGKREYVLGPKVLREVRFLPIEKYPFHNEIMLYDDKVAIYSGVDEVGIILENESIAGTWRAIWRIVWDFAEEHTRKIVAADSQAAR
jgi:sugar-specific transcriptional regulator TrmB